MARLDRQIYEALAEGMARSQQPDLSEFDAADVDVAMSRVFTFSGPSPAWLEWLRQRVAALSGNRCRLEDADPSEFPYKVKEPSAAYMQLVQPHATALIIVGPFQPPVQIIKR